jgi:shikimate kinase
VHESGAETPCDESHERLRSRVDQNRQFRNLSLIGFMGTGKTSVGRLVAETLHFTFLDTDEVIKARAGKSIAEIFTADGELAFRAMERQIVEELSRRDKTVLATGGGLPIQTGNLESLQRHSLIICLWASPAKIWERVRGASHRPLLEAPDPLNKIVELLAVREPHYRRADVLVNTEFRSLREVAHQVVHQYQAALSSHG